MTIERLREVLAAVGLPASARELTEILWLACQLTAEQPSVSGTPADSEPGARQPGVQEALTEGASQSLTEAGATRAGETGNVIAAQGLYAEARNDGDSFDAGTVQVPTAPMLHNTLALQRALRPLKRKVASDRADVLDENATARRIAEQPRRQRRWVPVMQPSPERWLNLALVVDTGPSMWIWRPLARELQEALTRLGAFRDLRIWYLNGTGVATTPDGPSLNAAALVDPSGRQACLVLSDCSGTHWWDGSAPRALHLWGENGPAAILQPLAERLWRRTAVPPIPGLAQARRAAATNIELLFTPHDASPGHGIPVPVMEIAPRWLADWARLIAGPSSPALPMAVAYISGRPMTHAESVLRERDLPITERVQRFQATASPEAARLAAHVAVSVPTLPVMRLIHHRLLSNPQPGHIAEVLLSGLLRSVGNEPGRYEFIPGARHALLATQPRSESWYTADALARVSSEIEDRLRRGGDTFRAYLRVPAGAGDRALVANQPFALVSPEALSYLRRDATVPTSGADQHKVPTFGETRADIPSEAGSAEVSQTLEEVAEDVSALKDTDRELSAASEDRAHRTGAKVADGPAAPSPEATAERTDLLAPRSALIISASRYTDSRLSDLPAAARDVEELAALLGDPQTGGFHVTVLRDPSLQTLTRALQQFLVSRRPEETALVYLSGHGLLSPEGRLIFAASDTEPDLMAATGLDLRLLTDFLKECLAQRQTVILDCSHSGKFADIVATTMSGLPGAAGEHCSRLVVTASRAEESALEEGFTTALLEGLRSGAADRGGDGLVSVWEAYAYVKERLLRSGQRQAPQIVRSGEGIDTMILTRAPAQLGSAPPVAASTWEHLGRLPGLDGVRRQLREIIEQPKAEAGPGGSSHLSSTRPGAQHLIFVGGPGTGKTTVARLLGEIYRELGLLRRGHVVTASRSDLVAGYVGQTAIKTNALVDRALDGVLFLDEAYALGSDRMGFGQEAMDTLLHRMDHDRERLLVILAGYPAEMNRFLRANPGLRSRFPSSSVVTFEDYDPDALLSILLDRLRSVGMHWTDALESQLREVTAGMYRTRTPDFGNARAMVALAKEIESRWMQRVGGDPSQPLEASDFPGRIRVYLEPSVKGRKVAGHVFISYTHEDSDRADRLQRVLEAAGIPVWRDTSDLWPGQDWRTRIRSSITGDALAFLACFSRRSLARARSYQNEELAVAIEQLRLRPPDRPWLIPVRFDDCKIPGVDLGAGRTLASIQHADLFGERYDEEAQRLVTAILRILGQRTDSERSETARAPESEAPAPRTEPATLLAGTDNAAEAEPWLQRAAEAGDPGAMCLLGGFLESADRTDEAERWYTRAAEAGDTDAMFRLGLLHHATGRMTEAEAWLKQAADAGHVESMRTLGELLSQAGRPVEAVHCYRRAANTGDAEAMRRLAFLLQQAGGVQEAEQWFRLAAHAGDPKGMAGLGGLLQQADRVEEAEEWYRNAADLGETGAMTLLGLLLAQTGRTGQALDWLQRAAQAGDSTSMTTLGMLYRTARPDEAERWFRKATEANDTNAMRQLGRLLHETGRAEEAESWLRRAETQQQGRL